MQKTIKRGFGQKSQASFALIQCILLCNQLLWRKYESKSWKCGCYLESLLSGSNSVGLDALRTCGTIPE